MASVEKLYLKIVFGDASESVEAHDGTMTVALDREACLLI